MKGMKGTVGMPIDSEAPPLVVYPSQREAAKILRISESTLSRSSATGLPSGERGRRYSARTVLEEAAKHRRRSLNEVAADLMAYARAHSPEAAQVVEGEIQDFFGSRERPHVEPEHFLAEARRSLPRRLYEQVKHAYEEGLEEAPVQLVGRDPQEEQIKVGTRD
jgi:hypothetical protein